MLWRISITAMVLAVILSLTAGFLIRSSAVLGASLAGLVMVITYTNFPMLLVLGKYRRSRRPLPRLAIIFWLGVLDLLKLPRAILLHMNNRVTCRYMVRPQEVHVLVSRCLQAENCKCQVTESILRCRACGACKIQVIKDLCAAKGLSVSVESGGTSARQRLGERKPKLVIAVACERELLAGILDTVLPVVGIMLRVGEKACVNSDVDVKELDRRLNSILKEG